MENWIFIGCFFRISDVQMMKIKQTILKEFIPVDFSVYPRVQTFLFVVFFCLYLLTLTSNLAIMGLTRVDRCLHIPMYLFLSSLSFFETLFEESPVPWINNLGLLLHNCMSPYVTEKFALWHVEKSVPSVFSRGWHMGIMWLGLGLKLWQVFS